MEVDMPFSSLRDPVDLARAHSAFNLAWTEIVADGHASRSAQAERDRLAQIIVALVQICADETELVERAIERFAQIKVEP